MSLTYAGRIAPKSIDHTQNVLVRDSSHGGEVGAPDDNPARGVDLPTLKTVRPKWALTIAQGLALLKDLATGANNGRTRAADGFETAASCLRCVGTA